MSTYGKREIESQEMKNEFECWLDYTIKNKLDRVQMTGRFKYCDVSQCGKIKATIPMKFYSYSAAHELFSSPKDSRSIGLHVFTKELTIKHGNPDSWSPMSEEDIKEYNVQRRDMLMMSALIAAIIVGVVCLY